MGIKLGLNSQRYLPWVTGVVACLGVVLAWCYGFRPTVALQILIVLTTTFLIYAVFRLSRAVPFGYLQGKRCWNSVLIAVVLIGVFTWILAIHTGGRHRERLFIALLPDLQSYVQQLGHAPVDGTRTIDRRDVPKSLKPLVLRILISHERGKFAVVFYTGYSFPGRAEGYLFVEDDDQVKESYLAHKRVLRRVYPHWYDYGG